MTVHAWAHPEKKETYVVAKGEYFAGGTRDPSIEKMSFESVARNLAGDLAKQNYLPTKEVQDADLLIVVHWGTTTPYVSDYDLQQQSNPNYYDAHSYDFALANPMGDPGINDSQQATLHQIYNNQNLAHDADAVAFDSAAHTLMSTSIGGILGYTSVLAKMGKATTTTEEEKTLLVNESEERYFIIVCAFDMHELLENHHKKLLWTSHMSMRAPGTNFTEAVPRMGQVAAATFGQNLDNILQQQSLPDPTAGHVKIGPIRILGMTAAPVAAAAK